MKPDYPKIIITDEESLSRIVNEAVAKALEKFVFPQSSEPIVQAMDTDEFGDLKWVCKTTKYSRVTLYSFVSKKLIPYYKKGRKLIFNKQEIIQWIKDSRKKTKVEVENEVEQFIINKKSN